MLCFVAEAWCSWVCKHRCICWRYAANHWQLFLVQSPGQFSSENGSKVAGALYVDHFMSDWWTSYWF